MAKNLDNKQKLPFILTAVGVLLILLLSSWYVWQKKHDLQNLQYSAVFLDNGQVYFGKIIKYNKNFLELVDIYYLQMKEQLQNQDKAAAQAPNLTLIKLGQELHGPTDKMVIPINSIAFTESLKADSKVIQAINNYAQ